MAFNFFTTVRHTEFPSSFVYWLSRLFNRTHTGTVKNSHVRSLEVPGMDSGGLSFL